VAEAILEWVTRGFLVCSMNLEHGIG
jgi:hypothetical protein